jgi:hypothetical protein
LETCRQPKNFRHDRSDDPVLSDLRGPAEFFLQRAGGMFDFARIVVIGTTVTITHPKRERGERSQTIVLRAGQFFKKEEVSREDAKERI